MGRLSLKTLTAEGFEGGLLYWGPWRMVEMAMETSIYFHRGSVGEPGRGIVYRGCEK
jgi:hypothetical protein